MHETVHPPGRCGEEKLGQRRRRPRLTSKWQVQDGLDAGCWLAVDRGFAVGGGRTDARTESRGDLNFAFLAFFVLSIFAFYFILFIYLFFFLSGFRFFFLFFFSFFRFVGSRFPSTRCDLLSDATSDDGTADTGDRRGRTKAWPQHGCTATLEQERRPAGATCDRIRRGAGGATLHLCRCSPPAANSVLRPPQCVSRCWLVGCDDGKLRVGVGHAAPALSAGQGGHAEYAREGAVGTNPPPSLSPAAAAAASEENGQRHDGAATGARFAAGAKHASPQRVRPDVFHRRNGTAPLFRACGCFASVI